MTAYISTGNGPASFSSMGSYFRNPTQGHTIRRSGYAIEATEAEEKEEKKESEELAAGAGGVG
jgi:UDP-N-acetylenolpyruvoylglucosamine reductase